MKICQTLWSCHKDLLEDSFGWLSAQHHLMAWVYSCLKLHEFYPNVQLYTDSHGAEILMNALNLPYTTCHVDYDNLRYNPSLWALPKILTYKKQVESFIHVDGDVFIFEKFNDRLENSALVAQNMEVSTDYYRNLFIPIMKRMRYTPDFFKENLFSKYPKSYNAGILGGNNIELIKEYTGEAIKFVDQNHVCQSNGNLNMIFEQLMFYSIAKTHSAEVQCYYDKKYDDNGYVLNEFADFLSLPEIKYLHLIGPLKRNVYVCNQLVRRLFNEYPYYFEKVISLFEQSSHTYFTFHKETRVQNDVQFRSKRKFIFFRTKSLINKLYPEVNIKSNKSIALLVKEKNNRVLNEVYKYEKRLHYFLTRKFSRVNRDDILKIEKKVIQSNAFLIDMQKNIFSCTLYLNPYIEIIETSFDIIDFNPYEVLRDEKNQKTVACVPQLFFEGYRTVKLDDVSINIISILYEESIPITFNKFEEKMSELFYRVDNDETSIRHLIIKNIKLLIGSNIIYLDTAFVDN
jgi:hypothetical protein